MWRPGSTNQNEKQNGGPPFGDRGKIAHHLRQPAPVPRYLAAAMIAGFWILVALTMVSNELWRFHFNPENCPSIAYIYAQLPQYGLWALATPFIFWLSGHRKLHNASWLKKGAIHLGAGLMVTLLIGLLNGFAHNFFYHPEGPGHSDLPWIWRHVLGKTHPNMLVYLAILSGGFAWSYFRRHKSFQLQQALLQNQLAQARFQALQTQIQPHFLFNTLNTISALTERDPQATKRVVARLSQLLRHSLESHQEETVPLSQELGFLQGYLEIVSIRFGPRLVFDLQIDEQVLAAMVPNLFLQPLVENAIKHGFPRMPDPGRVAIGARQQNGQLHLWVHDNGVGADLTHLQLGVGLGNVYARLEQLYGQAFQWQIGNGTAGGLNVDIRFPLSMGECQPIPFPQKQVG